MASHEERRRATRIATAISAQLIVPDGTVRAIQLENLSVIGLFGAVSQALEPGTPCRIELATRGLPVEARGTVVRCRAGALAVRFDELPYESYERLRAFLLLNARDPVVLRHELDECVGFLDESA